jgi:hypothetical protein
LKWTVKVPTAHYFVGERSGLNKTAEPHLTENLRPLDFFTFFERIFPINLDESNRFFHQDLAASTRWIMTGETVLEITGPGIRLVQAAMSMICIREVLVQISVGTSAILTEVFCGFPHKFQANAGIVPQVRP